MTYDEMRPGCYEPKARVEDLALAGVDGSLAFPTFPRFCGQTFMEGQGPRARAGVRARVQRLDDRRLVRRLRRSPDPAVPHPDVGRRASRSAEVTRNAARGARAVCFSEIPPHLGLPSIHTGLLGSAVRGVRGDAHDAVHAHRLVVEDAGRVTRRATVDRHHAVVQQLDGVAGRLPVLGRARAASRELKLAYSEGQIGWIPYALERADNVWKYHSSWTRREGDDPRAAVDLLPRPDLRVLHERRPRGGVDRRGRRGQHLLRDRLPAHATRRGRSCRRRSSG